MPILTYITTFRVSVTLCWDTYQLRANFLQTRSQTTVIKGKIRYLKVVVYYFKHSPLTWLNIASNDHCINIASSDHCFISLLGRQITSVAFASPTSWKVAASGTASFISGAEARTFHSASLRVSVPAGMTNACMYNVPFWRTEGGKFTLTFLEQMQWQL